MAPGSSSCQPGALELLELSGMSHMSVLSSADGNDKNRTAVDACSVFSLSSFPSRSAIRYLCPWSHDYLYQKLKTLCWQRWQTNNKLRSQTFLVDFLKKTLIWQAFGSLFVPESICLPPDKICPLRETDSILLYRLLSDNSRTVTALFPAFPNLFPVLLY